MLGRLGTIILLVVWIGQVACVAPMAGAGTSGPRPDLPHQYCQAHYLSNAVTPLYEADEHVKTQLRKQVWAAAGTTMRQVQAKAKQKAPDDSPPLIATGLAVRPPDGLDQVKAVARAAQARRGKVTAPPDLVTPAMPAQPAPHPQTVADVRATLQDSNVLVYEHRRNEDPPHASALPDSSMARLSASTARLSSPKSEPAVTAVLPLITAEDIAELAQGCPKGMLARTWAHERDIRRVVRLVKAGLDNPAGRQLLSLADLSVLINRSINTVRRCILDHFERTGELLPIKGYVLDQGSSPTHKGAILRLYEKGIAPPDIARITGHSLEAVDRYIKDYERVKVLLSKGLSVTEISHAIGRGLRTVLQYHEIALEFHPDLAPAAQEEG